MWPAVTGYHIGMKAQSIVGVVLLSFGMSCSPIKIHSNSFALALPDKIQLAEVAFAYDSWSNQDAEFLAKMKTFAPRWTAQLTSAFEEAARSAGILDAAGVPVTVTITDLNPGSQAARYFLGGFGVGKGQILARASSAKGEITAGGELTGGAFGGEFDSILRALGEDLAEAIAAKRQ